MHDVFGGVVSGARKKARKERQSAGFACWRELVAMEIVLGRCHFIWTTSSSKVAGLHHQHSIIVSILVSASVTLSIALSRSRCRNPR